MRHGHLAGIMTILTMALFRPPIAVACSCIVGPETCPSIAEADGVFEATVTSIERRESPSPHPKVMFQRRIVHLTDVRVWRGQSDEVVTTGGGGGDCGYEFEVGTRYLIVAHRSDEDGQLTTGICSKTRPLAQASGVRDYIESLARPSQGGRLWGRVVMPSPGEDPGARAPHKAIEEPMRAVQVSLDGPVRLTRTTDASGQYSFAALSPGEYSVRIDLPPNLRHLRNSNPRTVNLDRAYACDELNFSVWRDRERARGYHLSRDAASRLPGEV